MRAHRPGFAWEDLIQPANPSRAAACRSWYLEAVSQASRVPAASSVALEGVGPEGPQDDARGPEDARPGECAAMVHGADRCKFQPGTKAQNRG